MEYRNGSAWSWADEIVRTGSYLMPSPSLAFDAAGTAMVAFRCDNYYWFAWRNANAPGGWSVEAVELDPDASLSWISLAVDTQGNPAITNGYGFSYDHELRFAVRSESIHPDP